MIKASVDFQTVIPNDNSEELEVDLVEHSITLRIAKFGDCPSQTIALTFPEFDELAALVDRYKQMRRLAGL